MSTFKRQLTSALALNLCLKMFSFALSTALTRLLLPEQSGVGFSYAIYTDTVLFLAREAVRTVAVRQPLPGEPCTPTEKEGTEAALARGAAVRQVLYLGFLAVPVGLIVMSLMEAQSLIGVAVFPCLLRDRHPTTLLSIADFLPFLSVDVSAAWAPLFTQGMACVPHALVWSSVGITLLAEPCVVLAQCLGCFSRVVMSEFVTLVARLLVTTFFVWYSPLLDKWETQLFFAFGYVAASLAHLVYWTLTCRRRRQQKGRGESATTPAHAHDALHCAVEDSYLLLPPTRPATGAPQRRESCAVNAARTDIRAGRLVLPFPFHCFAGPVLLHVAWEHRTLLTTFGRESVLRLVLSEGEKFTLTVFGSDTARGHYATITQLGSLVARLVFRVWENACGVRWGQLVASGQGEEAVQLLALMLRLSVGAGLTFPILGPPLAAHFLTLLYSTRWSSPAMVSALQWFCLVVPCLAINGLLEAFLRAASTPKTLTRLQTCMVTESVVYMLACYAVLGSSATTRLGVVDKDSVVPLICLNLANMVCRIMRSIVLILLDSQQPQRQQEQSVHGKQTSESAVRVVVPVSTFTAVIHPAFALAVAALSVLTRAVNRVGVALAAAVLYPVLLVALDAEVRRLGQRLLRSRSRHAKAGVQKKRA